MGEGLQVMSVFRCLASLSIVLVAAQVSGQSLIEVSGQLSGRAAWVESPPSWLDGGFGRLEAGGRGSDSSRIVHLETANLGLDLHPVSWMDIHVHGIGRNEPDGSEGEPAGVVEAYVDVRPVDSAVNHLRVRAGMFFLPTSRENVENLWSSPYTLSFSALNSWIAQELRPVGAEIEYGRILSGGDRFVLAAAGFGGNDSSGTLLAWRGWSVGSRLGVYGEVLPLPGLASLADPTIFGTQRPDGTKSFGADRDDRIGWSARVRWNRSDRFTFQAAFVDNLGDRDLHEAEYAWRTRLIIAGGDLRVTENVTIAAEVASGSTGMGFGPRAWVQANLYTGYLLASYRVSRHRISVRADTFNSADRDGSLAEINSEQGSAITLAYFFDRDSHVRVGLELVDLSESRPAGETGFPLDADGTSGILELRYAF